MAAEWRTDLAEPQQRFEEDSKVVDAMKALLLLFLVAQPISGQLSRVEGPGGPSPRPSGVVIENVQTDSPLSRAGLQPGDRLQRWESLPTSSSGNLDSPFEWAWLEREMAPRGTVRLEIVRQGQLQWIDVDPGVWESEVRPWLDDATSDLLARVREAFAERRIQEGLRLWREGTEDLAAELGDDTECWLRYAIGRALSEAQAVAEALGAYRPALEQASSPEARFELLFAMGGLHRQLGQFEKALEVYTGLEDDLDLWGPESLHRALVLNAHGQILRLQGELESADGLHRRALAMTEILAPRSNAVVRSLNNLGAVARLSDRLDEAAGYFRRALDLSEALGFSLAIANSATNLGNVAIERGENSKALLFYRRAHDIYEARQEDSIELVRTLSNLGGLTRDSGDYGAAIDYLTRAAAIGERVSPVSMAQAGVLFNLGLLQSDVGKVERGREYLLRAFDIIDVLAPRGIYKALILSALGAVEKGAGDLELAESYLERALEIQLALNPKSLDVAYTDSNLGDIALEGGDLDKADGHYQRMLAIVQSLAPGSLREALAWYNLGRLARRTGELDRARARFSESLRLFERLAPETIQEAAALWQLAAVERESGDLKTAELLLQRATTDIENQIVKLGGSRDEEAGFRAQYLEAYRDLLEIQLATGRVEEAFHTLERSRAQSFLAQLGERELIFSELPESLAARRRELARRRDDLMRRAQELSAATDPEHLEALRHDWDQVREEASGLEQRIRQALPRFAELTRARPENAAEVASWLDPGTLILAYSLGEASSDLILVQQGRPPVAFPIAAGREAIEQQVGKLLAAIQQSAAVPGVLIDALSRNLYDLLIRPAQAQVDSAERLLILPEGILNRLPFPALERQKTDGSTQYLVEIKPLHFATSATVFGELKKRRRSSDSHSSLSVFGDPSYPLETPESIEAVKDWTLRGALDRGFRFAPLPHSRQEAQEIAKIYGTEQPPFVGAEATETRLKDVARDTDILHLALHAQVDEERPLSSFLAFSIPEESDGNSDNGLLQAWEIFEQLRLDASLVVLSACESGLGKEVAGEGPIGLTRAFQYAGARSVLASLWSVTDITTAELMTRFHRYLRAGNSKDEALRLAQLDLIRAPLLVTDPSGSGREIDASPPVYWAAFQLYGDWQ